MAKASASSIECVVNKIEEFLLSTDSLLIYYHKCLLDIGSIPLVGSSNSIIGGVPIKATAAVNFLLFPPE